MTRIKQSVLKVMTLLTTSLVIVSCSSPTKYQSRHADEVKPIVDTNKKVHTCHSPYRVVAGDTLSGIAVKCDSSIAAIANENHLLPPYIIYINQDLILPIEDVTSSKKKTSSVKEASKNKQDTKKQEIKHLEKQKLKKTQTKLVKNNQPKSSKISAKKETTAKAISRNQSINTHKSSKKSKAWVWPMHKGLAYRYIRDHAGLSVLEIYGVPGQKVRAVAPGKVVYAGNGIINYGWMLVIKHNNGYMSIYAHNSALLVKEGDDVDSGQEVALMGATGNTKRPKLYVEARYQGRKVDIKKVLKQ
ncbi:M23 family metallopeptidase [Thiomicrorhabdus sp. Milos-T2]|uniref:M23 family metallopeptidase n=1 Tax=Thiomicrorhabdus sp. Milos-T2 TaxID=90814 RepID=UPI00049435D6|nr:M23 family metallopeptidase [Thiomicrorhabdus sp. Milos-T2]